MKSFKKAIALFVALVMVFGVTATASAATAFKNGSYDAATDADSQGTSYKMHVDVVDGKISTATFVMVLGNGQMELTDESVNWLPAENQTQYKNLLQLTKSYANKLNETKDGSKVSALPLDETIYPAFAECWKKIAATATEATVTAPTVAKTKITLYLSGANKKLTYKISLKDNEGYKVTYKSEKANVASVSAKGVITAKKAGTTNVVVTFKKGTETVKKTIKVTIKAK